MKHKKRLDTLLVERGLATGRDKAKALIMQGIVYADRQKAQKPGDEYDPQAEIEVRGKAAPYVSRGGIKLEKAMEVFGISAEGKVCADIGASTGGFTDCLLGRGAKKVYAVDVGYGQLAWRLREDERVAALERTNARYLTKAHIPEPLRLITVDVSFISLTLLLPALIELLEEGGEIVCLVKPQFEAGREKVGKRGVVRDGAVHREVIERIMEEAGKLGLSVLGLDYSPIKGPKGNIEYLIHLGKKGEMSLPGREDVQAQRVVWAALEKLEENHESFDPYEFR